MENHQRVQSLFSHTSKCSKHCWVSTYFFSANHFGQNAACQIITENSISMSTTISQQYRPCTVPIEFLGGQRRVYSGLYQKRHIGNKRAISFCLCPKLLPILNVLLFLRKGAACIKDRGGLFS